MSGAVSVSLMWVRDPNTTYTGATVPLGRCKSWHDRQVQDVELPRFSVRPSRRARLQLLMLHMNPVFNRFVSM